MSYDKYNNEDLPKDMSQIKKFVSLKPIEGDVFIVQNDSHAFAFILKEDCFEIEVLCDKR